jgi:hypothetical protein
MREMWLQSDVVIACSGAARGRQQNKTRGEPPVATRLMTPLISNHQSTKSMWFEASSSLLSSSKLVAFRRRPRIASRSDSLELTRRHYGRRALLSWSSPALQSWRRIVSPHCLGDPSVWFRRKIQRATLRCSVPTLARGAHPTAISPGLRRSCRVLPERLRRPSRALATFVRFCAPTACPIARVSRWRARQRPPSSTFQRP